MIAAAAMMLALVPCGVVCLRGKPMDRLVGLEMTGVVMALLMIVLAQAIKRTTFYDLGLAVALLAFGGGLVYARFLERWL